MCWEGLAEADEVNPRARRTAMLRDKTPNPIKELLQHAVSLRHGPPHPPQAPLPFLSLCSSPTSPPPASPRPSRLLLPALGPSPGLCLPLLVSCPHRYPGLPGDPSAPLRRPPAEADWSIWAGAAGSAAGSNPGPHELGDRGSNGAGGPEHRDLGGLPQLHLNWKLGISPQ
ncbi:wiskott-Aldrich syndrome protein family member 1-like [Zalophus californianus]|uniref:Wiskott-Aldrich syndrome protein family member 1-like n=1 Tax=Zalophus californianus TaxID=9704 RepID=A0A6P9FG29_ZALCA|nr:wiskott-Aldrich syndrome protein family member 1-like [Zalophus californianus]